MPLLFNNLYRFDEFVLDPANRAFSRAGTQIPLSAKSCQVLTYLVANPGRVVTKDELLKAVWPESFVEESNLPGYISGLRKALGDRAGYIATVPGLGYKFTASVKIEAPLDMRAQPIEFELQQVRETTHVVIRETSSPAAAVPKRVFRQWAFWITVAVLLVTAASIGYAIYRRSEPQQLNKVLVGDFINLTGDTAFDRTLKSSLELSLEQSPYIQLMGAEEVKAGLGMMQRAPDSPLLGELALELCRRQNYQVLLRGKITTSNQWGSDAMSLEIVNCITGKTLAELHADAYHKEAVLSSLDGLALRARRKVGESSQSLDEFKVPIANMSTFSFDALKAYNTGSDLGSNGKLLECIPYFQKAVDLDPKFAMAQSSLGTAYLNLGNAKKAAEYSKAGFELSEAVSQWEKFFIRYNYYAMTLQDMDSARDDVNEWVRIYPLDETGWEARVYIDAVLGDYPAGVQAAEQVLRLSPLKYGAEYANLAAMYSQVGRFADAKRVLADGEAQGRDTPVIHQLQLEIGFLEHDRQAIQSAIQSASQHPQLWISLETQAYFAADMGKEKESQALFQRAVEDAVKEGQPGLVETIPLDEATVEIDLGQMSKAMALLSQVKDHRSANWAVLATKAGSATAADAFLKQPNEFPQGTIVNKVLIPELKALLALRRNDPLGAISVLEQSRPYEQAAPEVIQLRGQACLAAKQGQKAEQEYRKLIDHPTLEMPTLPKPFVAHLGLARAYALQGRMDESRKEYEAFFSLWKDADADLVVLQQAHREFAALNAATAR